MADDGEFCDLLKEYLAHPEPGRAEAIRKRYNVDPATLRLPPGVRVKVRGEVHGMRDSFKEVAFSMVGLDWQEYVEVDQAYFRPADVPDLCGDPKKAREVLGWRPKTSFREMIGEMLEFDLAAAGLTPAKYLRDRSAKAS